MADEVEQKEEEDRSYSQGTQRATLCFKLASGWTKEGDTIFIGVHTPVLNSLILVFLKHCFLDIWVQWSSL